MNEIETFNKILKRYGREAVVDISGERTQIFAFIQPVRYQNKMYLNHENYDMGLHDNSCLLFIGPAEPDFTRSVDNTFIGAGRERFFVKRADLMYIGRKPLYIRAILVPRYLNGVKESV